MVFSFYWQNDMTKEENFSMDKEKIELMLEEIPKQNVRNIRLMMDIVRKVIIYIAV